MKVTKSSRAVKVRPHSETANERTLQKEKKKKVRKELLNFYTWQHRNTQKERESRDDQHHNHARVKTERVCDESEHHRLHASSLLFINRFYHEIEM